MAELVSAKCATNIAREKSCAARKSARQSGGPEGRKEVAWSVRAGIEVHAARSFGGSEDRHGRFGRPRRNRIGGGREHARDVPPGGRDLRVSALRASGISRLCRYP